MLTILSTIAIGAISNIVADMIVKLIDYVLAHKNDHPSRK